MKTVSKLLLAVGFLFLAACQKDSFNETIMLSSNDATIELRNSDSSFPDIIALPMGFEVEGIEIGKGTTFFASSLANGAIFKGNLRTGEGAIFNTPNDVQAVGLSYDARSDFLFVAGGEGKAFIYDGTSGQLVATFDLAAQAGPYLSPFGTLVNDVIVTRNAAYFTDSYNTFLYKLPLGPSGQLPASDNAVEIIPMNGFVYTGNPAFFGIEANGVVATPNGKKLIVNNMATGIIYLIDPQSGDATPIDIQGIAPVDLTWGDGLLLEGRTLYITRNFPNKIAVIQLSPDFTKGKWVKDIAHGAFVEPATVAAMGNDLYAVNAHFLEILVLGLDPATLPFEIVKVPK